MGLIRKTKTRVIVRAEARTYPRSKCKGMFAGGASTGLRQQVRAARGYIVRAEARTCPRSKCKGMFAAYSVG